MEIINYKKNKANIYELTLDNGSVLKLYDDTIIQYGLLVSKKIDDINEVVKYNDGLDAYYLALKYLNKKLRSHLEIEKYLIKKEFDDLIIVSTIKRLEQEGYLNSEHFLKSYLNDQINLTNNGPAKIKYNLIKLGFNEDEININYDFSDKIKKIIDKKVKLNHKLSTAALKLNINNYLINLGYDKEIFNDYLDNIKVNDAALIKKDYHLLFKKYQNKYDNDKLKLFIRDKLIKKGYNREEVSEVIYGKEY